jgi:TonB family protein
MIPAVLQSSAVLSVAFIAFQLVRGQSAALRHLILAVALFAAAVVPFLSRFVPEPARKSEIVARVQRGTEQFLDFRGDIEPAAMPTVQTPPSSVRVSFVPVLWIAGSFAVFMLILFRTVHIAILKRRATLLIDPRWERMASELCNSFRIRRPVRLLQTRRSILGTLGSVRPYILLPDDAEAWSDQRIRIVLMHELAHIKRLDWPIQIAAELAVAVYWFNPLFWWLCRQLRVQGEHACDNVVLNGGVHANDYAAQLLELARSLRGSETVWSPVLAMARPPHLERRFVAMLNPSTNRRPAGIIAVLTTSVIAVLLLAPLVIMGAQQKTHAVAALAEIVSPTAVPSPVKPAESAPAPARPGRKIASKPAPAPVQGRADGSLAGTVSDPTGAVLPRVEVMVYRAVTGNGRAETEVQTAKTDDAGRYSFAALTPGQYFFQAELPGFQAFRGSVDVEVSKTLTHNVTLSVGAVMQRVTVTAVGQAQSAPVSAVPRRIRVGGNVVAANLIGQVKPVYPASARDAGIEGTVHLHGLIGQDGALLGLTPLNNIDRDLTAAALEAVKQWRYKPTLLNGEPVEVLTTIDVEFKLTQ